MTKRTSFIISFLLPFILAGCQKDDKVYRELIEGEWGKQLYDKINGDVGFTKVHFKDDGYYEFFVRRGDTIDRCDQVAPQHMQSDSLRYYIEDGNLFKQDPYAKQETIIEYRILKLNENKLNIVVADRGNNQSISDRLSEHEIFQSCGD